MLTGCKIPSLRLRHWRGHGVHSPYVYALVRDVFMNRRTAPGDQVLYRELRRTGADRKTARQVWNLYRHCGCAGYGIGDGPPTDFRVLLPREPSSLVAAALACRDGIIIVLRPYGNREILHVCLDEGERQRGLSIDKGRFFAFFPAGTQPNRHFKL